MNTDNQQEIGLQQKLGWLAGVTDGEGYIALLVFGGGKRQTGHGFRLQMRVTIANSNDGVTERITGTLTQLGIGHHVQKQMSKSKGIATGRIMSLIHISSKQPIKKFLTIVAPHMADTEKRERGRIILKLLQQRQDFADEHKIRDTHCYTEADVDLILEFLRLTRSKQIERLAAILNDYTREARGTRTKRSRARHDIVWSHAEV